MNTTEYIGIDYGRGVTNIDIDTGIRYGVIPTNALDSWIYEELQGDYGDASCPECGAEGIAPVTELSDDLSFEVESGVDYACEYCEKGFLSEECFPESPISFSIDKNGYEVSTGSECGDLFITKAPFYTHAAFCSPCAPGACYLTSPVPEGERAYCFGHDWFEGNKAPYPVYNVETGKLVEESNE